MPRKKQEKGGVSFEELVEKIEGFVRELETGELGIEDAIARYEEGVGAIMACRKILDEAEKKIEMLVAGRDGGYKAEPFNPGAAAVPKDGESPPRKGGKAEGKKDEVEGLLF